MSRLLVPLLSKKIWATGDIVLRAELELLIRDENGILRPETFRVDSGTEMTSMAAARAKVLGLPMPLDPIFLDINGIKREVRPGLILAQVVGMGGIEHVFPCYFLGNPHATPDPNQPRVATRNLLGLTGVLNEFRILFDGTPSANARYGVMVIENT